MSGNPITIRNLGPEDAHLLDRVRAGTFDEQLDPARVWAFLATRVNELVVALDQGEVVGFAFGTMLLRPDKPTAFFVNDVRVNADYRRQGIAKRLIARITELAMDRGCEDIWVLAEAGNDEARQFYRALDGTESPETVIYDWPV